MRPQRGFTLTELAVVFTIVALLLGGLIYTLSAQMQQRDIDTTTRRLEEAREALIGFAIVNGRLPCPAQAPFAPPFNNSLANGVGVESPAGGGACTDGYTGFLPARTLGLAANTNGYALDGWGNPIRYAVSKDSNPAAGAPNWNFTTPGLMRTNGIMAMPQDLVVCQSAANIDAANSSCNLPGPIINFPVTNQTVVVAVVWTQGRNSQGTVAAAGDEAPNNKHRMPASANDHGVFVSRPPSQVDSPLGEYDDMMVWLPVGTVYGRMIAAGQLP